MRRWRVTVDDPSAFQIYTFEDIDAEDEDTARAAGARRAIVEDPGATTGREVPSAERKRLAASKRMVEEVARYAVAVEIGGAS